MGDCCDGCAPSSSLPSPSLPGADESSSNDLWLDRRIDTAAAVKEGYKVVYRRTKEGRGKDDLGRSSIGAAEVPIKQDSLSVIAKKLRDIRALAHALAHLRLRSCK